MISLFGGQKSSPYPPCPEYEGIPQISTVFLRLGSKFGVQETVGLKSIRILKELWVVEDRPCSDVVKKMASWLAPRRTYIHHDRRTARDNIPLVL